MILNRVSALLFLLMFALAAPAFSQEAAVEADVALIMSTYDANELAGDQKFKGKRVKVSGTISRIAADTDGTPYVGFRTPDGAKGLFNCYFPKESTDALVQLKKGQEFVTTCTVKGKERSFVVRLEDCVID